MGAFAQIFAKLLKENEITKDKIPAELLEEVKTIIGEDYDKL